MPQWKHYKNRSIDKTKGPIEEKIPIKQSAIWQSIWRSSNDRPSISEKSNRSETTNTKRIKRARQEEKEKGGQRSRRNLMNRRIHRIGANGTFKKLVDTCGGGIVVIDDSRLRNRRKLTVTLKGLILLVHHIHGWHAFDAIQLHFRTTIKPLRLGIIKPTRTIERKSKCIDGFWWARGFRH